MSRDEREALQAKLDADPVFRAAWEGVREQIGRFSTALGSNSGQLNDEAMKALNAAHLAMRDLFEAAGLDPNLSTRPANDQ